MEKSCIHFFNVSYCVPRDIRLQRVKDRSFRKFGNRMLSGGDLFESVSDSAPHLQFLFESFCIQNKVKPILIKRLKATCFQFKGAFNIIDEYLPVSFPACNQPIIAGTSICAKMKKSIWSIVIMIKTSCPKVFFSILFIGFFQNTEIFQDVQIQKLQLWVFGQSVQVGVPQFRLSGTFCLCVIETKRIESIPWSCAAVTNLCDKLDIIFRKPEVIFFLYCTDKCQIDRWLQLVLMLRRTVHLQIRVHIPRLRQYLFNFLFAKHKSIFFLSDLSL